MSLVVPILAVFLAGLFLYKQWSKSKGPLPPGPPKHWFPLVGNAHQIVSAKKPFPCLLMDWREQYGDIYSFSVLGQHTIVVNTAKDAHELFDLRSSLYSSRTNMPLLRDFLCRRGNIAFEPYGDSWRRHRRATHRELNVNQVGQYSHVQEREAYILTQGFYDYPDSDHLLTLLQRFGGSVGLGALYDHKVTTYRDPMVEEFSFVLENKLALLQPGASLYDYLPWFRWAPEWLMVSKKRARIAREQGEALDARMSKVIQDRLAKGDALNCFHAGLLSREKESGAELSPFERDSLSGTLVGAAVDTTTASLHVIVLALIMFPDVQRKLQEEVDAVVGRERMPNVQDVPNLPYTRAFVREALRWRSVTPFSLPHAISEDDHYKGYFIPKGSTIIGNSFAMEHDASVFEDHEIVRPERYLDPDTNELNEKMTLFTFGFGRRACPGNNMALSSLALSSACMMWALQFEKKRDARGNVMEPDCSPENIHDGGNVFRPNPFPYAVNPRPGAEQTVRQAVAAAY